MATGGFYRHVAHAAGFQKLQRGIACIVVKVARHQYKGVTVTMPNRIDFLGQALRYPHALRACSRFSPTPAGRMQGKNMQCVAAYQLAGGVQYVARGMESCRRCNADSMIVD